MSDSNATEIASKAPPAKISARKMPAAPVIEMRQTAVAEARSFWELKLDDESSDALITRSAMSINYVLDTAEKILEFYLTGKSNG